MRTQQPNTHTNISHIKGNLIEHIAQILNKNSNSTKDIIVPECFSSSLLTDSKFAKTIFSYYPAVEINLNLYRQQNKYFGTTQFVEIYNKNNKNFGKVIFANMICKRHNRNSRQLDYIALAKCLTDIKSYIRTNYKDRSDNKPIISTIRFGCGKSGGNWNLIEPMVQDALDPYKVEVYQTTNDYNIHA